MEHIKANANHGKDIQYTYMCLLHIKDMVTRKQQGKEKKKLCWLRWSVFSEKHIKSNKNKANGREWVACENESVRY